MPKKDWCHDSPSQKFTLRHRQFEKEKIRYFEKTINLQKLEIIDALVHDNMPVFSVSFETHTLMAYQDKDGNLLTAKEYPQVWRSFMIKSDPDFLLLGSFSFREANFCVFEPVFGIKLRSWFKIYLFYEIHLLTFL